MNLIHLTQELSKDFLGLIFPNVCIGCSTPMVKQEDYLCTGCRLRLPKTNLHSLQDNYLAQKFAYEPKIGFVSAFLYYTKGGIAQKLIHELKYRNQPELGVKLGQWYGQELRRMNLKADLMLPVPLHKSKLEKRGFNQSAKIAIGLGGELGIGVKEDVVIRTRNTSSQTQKTKVERWGNIDSMYQIQDSKDVLGKHIVIVDDVLTTGATIGALAETLSAYGARKLSLLTIGAGK